MKNNLFVISAHPDDEVLGLGGSLAKFIKDGYKIDVLIMCEAETMRYKNLNIDLKKMAEKAGEIIGFNSIEFLNFPDQHLDKFSLVEIIKPIEEKISKLKPKIVFTHFYGDINKDHKILSEATIVATRPFKNKVEMLLGYETPSSTEWELPYKFSPNLFVDISKTIDIKIKAMECYKTEVNNYPHPRSIESLNARASYWGAFCNMKYAEPFFIYRKLWF